MAFESVSCGSPGADQILGGIQVVGVGSDGRLWHTLRHVDGSWQNFFGLIETVTSGGSSQYVDVGCASDDGMLVLQLVGAGGEGSVWHTLRKIDTTWDANFFAVPSQLSSFQRISCCWPDIIAFDNEQNSNPHADHEDDEEEEDQENEDPEDPADGEGDDDHEGDDRGRVTGPRRRPNPNRTREI